MANNNDGYIQVVARLNETKSKDIIQDQLNRIQKQLQLQLSNVRITKTGQNMLQSSIDSIQKNLKVNISSVNVDQNKIVQQSQQVAQQISSSMSSALNNVDTSGLTRAVTQIDKIKDSLNSVKADGTKGNLKSFSSLDQLKEFIHTTLPQFKNIKTSIDSWYEGTTPQVKSFTAEILNGDKAVEKLSFHLQNLGVEGGTVEWAFSKASATDNAIKVQEQALKAAEREAKQLEASVQSGYKTLTHYVQMMNNLSQRQVFNKNASAPDVLNWQDRIATQTAEFEKLQTTMKSGVVTPETLANIKDLSDTITKIILDGHRMARTLGQATSNVNSEAEFNKLLTLYHNLQASDVEVKKLEEDYSELIRLFVEAEHTGDFSTFFNKLTVFKSKFAEAKSEVRATNAQIADLANMAKQLQSNKMTSFFNNNSGNTEVTALKTQINGLVTEWEVLNKEIEQTGSITPNMQTKLDNLRGRMEETTKEANKLQVAIKEDAASVRLFAQRNALDSRMANWLRNNTAASQEAKLKIMELKAQIQDADRQKMTNLTNEFRKVTAAEAEAGRTGKKFFEMAVEKIKKFTGWFSISMVIMRAVRYFKEMATTVRELDTALVDLRKTTTATNAQLEEFYYEANNIGKALGVTTKDVIEAASAWSRLGYNIKDAQEMAKTSSIFASISPGMDIEQSTDGLVSVLKAYKISAEDALDSVVSKINAVGNSQALSNADIVEFLTRSSSALAEANNNLDQAVALGTAATEVVRDAASVGTTLKTVAMRLRSYDEETEQYSEDLAVLEGEIASLTKTAKHPLGISLFTDSDKTTYKSTYQILKEISEIYNELTDKQQAEFCLNVQKCA